MNLKLLRKIQAHILEEPKRLEMGDWGAKIDAPTTDDPPCGTVGCIAGWACWLEMKRPPVIRLMNFAKTREETQLDYNRAEANGKRLLGLTKEESKRLFYVGDSYDAAGESWPAKFRSRFERSTTARTRARVTAERIDHFIATGGKE